MTDTIQNPEFQPEPLADRIDQSLIDKAQARPKVLPILIIFAILVSAIIGGFILYEKNHSSTSLDTPNSTSEPNSEISIQPNPETELKTDTKVVDSFNSFGFEIFKKLSSKNENKNVLVSPFSLASTFHLLNNGANQKTREDISKVLNVQDFDIDSVNTNHLNLINDLVFYGEDVKMNTASSVWISDKFKVLPNFKDIATNFYQAEIQNVDFSDTKVPSLIDSWVANKTQNKITQIAPSEISDQTMMFLINALYFKGDWSYEFDPDLTEKKDFINIDESKSIVDMMKQDNWFGYYENEDLQALSLPYGQEENFSLDIIMPKNYTEFKDKMSLQRIKSIKERMEKKECRLTLPKFDLVWDSNLSEILSELGMNIAFSQQADFSNIDGSTQLLLSNVIHKTYLEINEKGTQASSATSLEVDLKSVDSEAKIDKFVMEVNKPFLLVLQEEKTGQIIFLASVEKIIGK